jgi:Xaa-Pro aminopeptidase
MERNNIDALIAHTPENVFYSSNIFNRSQWIGYYNSEMFVIIPLNSEIEPCIILPSSTSGKTWIKDKRTYGPATYTLINQRNMVVPFEDAEYYGEEAKPSEILSLTLKEKDLANKKIVFDNLSFPLYEFLTKKTSGAIVSMSNSIFQKIRMVKTKPEIERLSNVVDIIENTLRVMFETIRTGAKVKDIALAIKQAAISQNAELELLIPLGGPDLEGGEYALNQGDLFFADIGLRSNGYLSDFGRTAVLNSPSPQVSKYYEAILRGEEEAIKAVKPGVKASEVFEIAVQTVRDEGIPHYQRGACGHGIGIGFDLPLIGSKDETLLEENMVLEVETPYREMGFGGFMLEDTIIVKKGGAKFLTSIDRGLCVI